MALPRSLINNRGLYDEKVQNETAEGKIETIADKENL